MQILGLNGSLRKGSLNGFMLKAAEKCLPEGVTFQFFNCGDLPFYNADLDQEQKPDTVTFLIESIRTSDALLIASPEYNHSIPGVLKNAIDWASRPAYQSVLANKAIGIISGSTSIVGGARMQAHLRQVLSSTLARVYPVPDFIVPQIQEKINHLGQITNQETLKLLQHFINGFVIWSGRDSRR